jgi:hypothetical protein
MTGTGISAQEKGSLYRSYDVDGIGAIGTSNSPNLTMSWRGTRVGGGIGHHISTYLSQGTYFSFGMRLEYSSYAFYHFHEDFYIPGMEDPVQDRFGSAHRKALRLALPIRANFNFVEDRLSLSFGPSAHINLLDKERTNHIITEYYYEVGSHPNSIWLENDPPQQSQTITTYHPSDFNITLGAGLKALVRQGNKSNLYAFVNLEQELIEGYSFLKSIQTFVHAGVEWRMNKRFRLRFG